MIELKEAVKAAEEFLLSYVDQAELKHLRLEEAELTDDERYWKVTLGWPEPATRQLSPALGSFGTMRTDILAIPRVYKQFLVDTTNGKVKSMKIYEP